MSRVSTLILTAAMIFGAYPLHAVAAQWEVLYDESTVTISGDQDGDPFEGTFETFTADIRFDPAAPGKGQADVIIDLSSLTMANGDQESTAKDWLNADETSEASYAVSGFEAADEQDVFIANGELTLNGQTNGLPLTFSFSETDGTAVAKGDTQLDRTAFGVGEPRESGVSNQITVSISIKAERAN